MPLKTTAWTDDEKKAHSEKSMRAKIEAAAAYKGCTVEELAAMPERELLKLQYLGRKTVGFLQNPRRGDPLQKPKSPEALEQPDE